MIKARASGSKVYLYFMKKGRQARHRILRNSCYYLSVFGDTYHLCMDVLADLIFQSSPLPYSFIMCLLCFQKLNSAIIYDRDYNYNYFGFKVRPYFNQSVYPIFSIPWCCSQSLHV